MAGLSDDAERYRRGNVGVITGSRVTHVAPQAKRVAALMEDLFSFLRDDDETPALVKACVFHYELEFIHPFSDGNGRAGRLWQHALLCAHSTLFALVPTESLIKAHQDGYYEALSRSDKSGDASFFVEFMLAQLHSALQDFASEFRPVRADASARLGLAARPFGRSAFARRQ